ncbi:MAG: serine/threonine protein kinase [Ktedonobacteraceae bacterium]
MASDYSGKQIGNYRVIEEIGGGTYGLVYRAEHIYLGHIVAIKLLHSYLDSHAEHEQFLQEAKFLLNLKHPYILSFYDFGIYEGFPYLIIEYAPNGSLKDLIKSCVPHPLPVKKSLSILSQIGHALVYTHQQNIVHRDLKPENILFNTKGEALLADFGIATVVSTLGSIPPGTPIGTLPYMAPEQFEGKSRKESDQYALGCIAYELVTGRQPFIVPNPSIQAMWFQHAMIKPIPPTQLNPNLPVQIEQAILKAMAKERTDRYLDVGTFCSLLGGYIESLQNNNQDSRIRQGNGSDLLGANDPRNATIGIIYVAPNDDRESVLAAILTQERLGRKQIAIVLPNQNEAFQRSVDFDGLKNMRRKLQANLIIVAPQGSSPAEFARQRRFTYFTSLENYAQSLQGENEASRATRKFWFGAPKTKPSVDDSPTDDNGRDQILILPSPNEPEYPVEPAVDHVDERIEEQHAPPNLDAAAVGLGMGMEASSANHFIHMPDHEDAADEDLALAAPPPVVGSSLAGERAAQNEMEPTSPTEGDE